MTSRYVNFSGAGSVAFFNGTVGLLASNRGIHLQVGGGTLFGPAQQNGRLVSPLTNLKVLTTPGGSLRVRASRSGINPGWATGIDAGVYALSVDPNGQASHEFGPMIGIPSFNSEHNLYI